MEKRFGTYDFQTLFEYILTDRGSEFGDPESLETGFTGIQRTSIYYCDPMRSGQKGGLEQAHTMLRMILPKKTNFEFLTQWDVNLIVSHINSTPRESLQGRTTDNKHFQPMGANMGILPPLPEESRPRDKRLRYMAQAQRAVASFQHWLDETSL